MQDSTFFRLKTRQTSCIVISSILRHNEAICYDITAQCCAYAVNYYIQINQYQLNKRDIARRYHLHSYMYGYGNYKN